MQEEMSVTYKLDRPSCISRRVTGRGASAIKGEDSYEEGTEGQWKTNLLRAR